ncbi:MAG: hypothetical protein CENE_01095 [Candidatus Celerinatantimonas neptuna]|nr:MAG: hypothetical protein CENE_01095 [Candidatus Celerinatantimonas neptuna]
MLDHYTFVATKGSKPLTSIDTSQFKNMGLKGSVPPGHRDLLAGTGLKNINNSYDYVIAQSNQHAQYWGKRVRIAARSKYQVS